MDIPSMNNLVDNDSSSFLNHPGLEYFYYTKFTPAFDSSENIDKLSDRVRSISINASNYIFIDHFPQSVADNDWGGDLEEFKQYYIDNYSLCKTYMYSHETFIYDGIEYYIWKYQYKPNDCDDDMNTEYLLTERLDFSGDTLEDDISNNVNPVSFILNSDHSLSYTSSQKSDYVIVAQRIINNRI